MNLAGIILFISTIYAVNSISLLRRNDLGRNDFLIHYHKDEVTGKHTRHIHYRSDVQRTRKTQQDTAINHKSNAVKPAPVYEVPSKSKFNEQYEAQLALNLRTLLKGPPKDKAIPNRNSNRNKTNVKFGKATTRFTNKPNKVLPSGLQFLKKTLNSKKKTDSKSKKPPVKNGMDLSLQGLLGDLYVPSTETPLVDTTKSPGDTLDLAFLLSDLTGGQNDLSFGHDHHGHPDHHGHHYDHSASVSAGDHHMHSDKGIYGAKDGNAKPMSQKMFMGMFNQKKIESQQRQVKTKESTTFSPHTIPVRSLYQESTVHARPITKRGVIDSESGRSYMDHVLRIKIRNTTPSSSTESVTKATRYGGMAATPSVLRTQIEPLSGIDLVGVRQKNRNTQKMPAAVKASLAAKPISSSELVHLKGIHVMFSDGKQNTSNKIPTIHLTATVNENVTTVAENEIKPTTPTSGSNMKYNSNNADTKQIDTVMEKIVGTAIIRNGHLYLVVYPFGANKTLELHHNQSVNPIKLPKNNPIPLSVINKLVALSTPKPSTTTVPTTTTTTAPTAPTAPTTPTVLDFGSLISSGFDMPEAAPLTDTHHHHDMHNHAHGMHDKHHHMPTFDGIQLSEVNSTALRQILTPVKRFMSPWSSLNFSDVFPYSDHKTNKSKRRDDEDVDIVTFIANATDPFDKIKGILESLSNTSGKSGAVKEAKFNFEVNLQTKAVNNIQTNKQSATNPLNENNSEEVRTVNKKAKESTTISGSGYDTTEPMVKSTQMPSVGSGSSFGANSINENMLQNKDAFYSKPTPIQTIRMFKNKLRLTTAGSRGVYESETATPPQTGTPDLYDSVNTTPATTYKTIDKKESKLFNAAENIATTTPSSVPVTKSYQPSRTTFTYFPNYTFSSKFRQPNTLVNTMQPRTHNMFGFSNSNAKTHIGSNIQSNIPQASQVRQTNTPRPQSEQLASLAEVLNDIKKIQLRSMQKLNARQNNFNTFLSESHQTRPLHAPVLVGGPVFKETSTRYSDIPGMHGRPQNNMNNFVTPGPITSNRQWKQNQQRANLRRALDAMLVLSVDDILADHTSLHGALVMPHRRESSSSNNK